MQVDEEYLDELIDNIEFIIKYCDVYIEYSHNENLSLNGDIAGEILDSITELEEYITIKDQLNKKDVKEMIDLLDSIYENLLNLNDIMLLNSIHIVINELIYKCHQSYEKNF